MFIQPDWFEVTQPGAGTNRCSYSFNDPVNLSDPNGNFVPLAVWGAVAAYKAVSAAIAVHDAYQTVQSVSNGSVSVGEAVAGVAGDVVIGATVGKGLAKVVEKVGGAVKSTVKDLVADERGTAKVPGSGRLGDVKHSSGVSLPTSQRQMVSEFEDAGYQSKPVVSPTSGKLVGKQYTLPDGSKVRVMDPDGRNPRRASFENSNGQPIDPRTGKPPQPPSNLTRAERKQYVRSRTHIEQEE
ncbi:hypothetical protein O2N63_08145 [Aliiroseovarius sp. KMU-50]|uniref:RHS repeat-associated core domain-containing protein n=1 Tax=Aliiroseovarius salicola TaxID=3009082 RepID=A0ABT4W0M1_9RHOB|nr:hypothetical protein [Aliiroseovarius sp. KMU-50]MDA5094059.1 hypothetical protein [Aliiroseovarius sp. KMU-50]